MLLKISSEAVTKLAGTEIFGRGRTGQAERQPKGNRLRKEEAELTDAGDGASAKKVEKEGRKETEIISVTPAPRQSMVVRFFTLD